MTNIIKHFPSKEIISEIESDFSEYSIDKIGLRNKLMSELRAFRDLVCIPSWQIVHINNKVGDLPNDFRSIISGLIVEPDTCYSPDIPREQILTSAIYTEVEEFIFTKDGCLTSEIIESTCQDKCITSDKGGSRIIETRIIEDKPVWFSYKSPRPIKLVSHQRGRDLMSEHINKSIESEYEVSVYDDQIHCNFNNGIILLEYNAFLLDDEGVPLIPDTGDDTMRDYLDASLRVYLLESPRMHNQDGFSNYAKTFWEIKKRDLASKKDDAKMSLTRLQKSQILEHKQLMKKRLGKFFSTYRYM